MSVWFIQVDALQGHRVIDVACGSGDAQTLCLTDDDMVWSWGDGDYGKLGRGGSDGCKIPMKVRQFTQQCALEVSRSIILNLYLLSLVILDRKRSEYVKLQVKQKSVKLQISFLFLVRAVATTFIFNVH